MFKISRYIHFPTFILLLGSIFIIIDNNIELSYEIRTLWTLVGLLLWNSVSIIKVFYGRRNVLPSIQSILGALFTVGCIESLYVLLQLFKLLHATNTIFSTSGSFDNPAVCALLFSLSIPSGLFLYRKTHSSKYKLLYSGFLTLMIGLIIISRNRTAILSSILSLSFFCFSYKPIFLKSLLQYRKYRPSAIIILILFTALLFLLYLMKKDSADGRLLIWKISTNMIADHPLLGFGTDGFSAHYMKYQALFLQNHNYDDWIMRADNIRQPFNVFLLVAVNFGLIGLSLFLVGTIIVLKRIFTLSCEEKWPLRCIILNILLWSLFFYPQSVHFLWFLILWIVLISFVNLNTKNRKILNISFVVVFAITLVYVPKQYYRLQWQLLANNYYKESHVNILRKYSHLNYYLYTDKDFLYNYGAILHRIKEYDLSINILNECTRHLNDYNVQMLLADNYQQMEYADSAIHHFQKAYNMIPNRFLPLFWQMQIYSDYNDVYRADSVARIIMAKQIKIESPTVELIKKRAGDLITQMP